MADIDKLNLERQTSLEFLSKHWKNFFNKFNDIETLKISQWKPVHLLAYFDKRYREHYNKNFAYTFRGAPSKCTEMVLIKKMCAMLATTNMRIVKEYIDWVFDNKIIPKNMKIRSLAFFGAHGLGNEFFMQKAEKEKIERNTLLPEDYKTIAEQVGIPADTFGDLAFIKMAQKSNTNSAIYDEFFSKLYSVGFEDEMIKDIK
jgi:hypothetical protein